jgi:hypothetical protein
VSWLWLMKHRASRERGIQSFAPKGVREQLLYVALLPTENLVNMAPLIYGKDLSFTSLFSVS